MVDQGIALFSRGRAAPAASRRTLVLAYALIFLNSMQFIGMVAVGPTYADDLGLSKFQTGLIFAVSGLATAAAAIPVGLLADRLGARRVALTGATIVSAALVLQGLAPNLLWLLVARVAIGMGFSAVLAAGIGIGATRRHGHERDRVHRDVEACRPVIDLADADDDGDSGFVLCHVKSLRFPRRYARF